MTALIRCRSRALRFLPRSTYRPRHLPPDRLRLLRYRPSGPFQRYRRQPPQRRHGKI